MEIHSRPHASSPTSTGGATAALQPLTPKPGEPNPYPTTFVQADSSSFKQVVQMLTGSAETAAKQAAAAAPGKTPPHPAAKATAPKPPAFKLYERRSSLRNLNFISPVAPAGFSPCKQPEILSPSMLDLPALVLSPITPLTPDPFNRPPPPPGSARAVAAEDRAIAEKGFYLHPSPRATPSDGEPPRLLPLFPVTSPSLSGAAAAAYSP